MGKVVIFRPPYVVEGRSKESVSQFIYLGVLCIGASLRKAGYDVVLIDGQLHSDWRDRIRREAPGCVYFGISAMVSQVYGGVEGAKIVREIDRNIPIVWGGVHPSILAEETLRSKWCDVAAIGSGDDTAVDIAMAFEKKLSLDGIGGVAYLRDGKFVSNPKGRLPKDLDSLEVPAYDLYTDEEMERFIVPAIPHPTAGSIRAVCLDVGRGCAFQCTFCINTIIPENNRTHRMKSAKRIADEMETLGKRYNAEYFNLGDEDFFSEKPRVMEFLDIYKERGFKYQWATNARANYFRDNYITREFCERLADCGCNHIGIGVESGSMRMLKRMKKGITPELVRRALETIAGTKLHLACSLMVGMPHEEREDIVETLKIMWDIGTIAPNNTYIIGPAIFRPYPGSGMYHEAVALGLKQPQSLEEWADVELSKWGYLKEDSLPWVKDHDLIYYIMEYMSFLFVGKTVSRFYALKLLIRSLMKPVTRWRIKSGVWTGLFEVNIFKLLKKISR